MELAGLRKSYEKGALLESEAHPDPLLQLQAWLNDARAAHIEEYNAMTLATVGGDGRPSSRIVLIKALDRGVVWYTNYDSRKARELAVHPFAALQFHWVALERQVRIEGLVEKTSAAESDAYFASRPRASRLGAWASPQSRVIANRDVLVEAEAQLASQYGEEIPRPSHWGGFRLVPDRFEFWQGRPSRLHDRLRYQQTSDGWRIERLAP